MIPESDEFRARAWHAFAGVLAFVVPDEVFEQALKAFSKTNPNYFQVVRADMRRTSADDLRDMYEYDN